MGIGSMVGGVVGGMFGGPIGAQIGSMLGGSLEQMLGGLLKQFGPENVAKGLSNCVMKDSAQNALEKINTGPFPQGLKDQMCEGVSNWLSDNLHSIPAACQDGCTRYYDRVVHNECHNEKLISPNQGQSGGASCTRTEADGGVNLDDADMKACDATNRLDKDKSESKEGKSCGNWLVELAKALADIQTEFLNKAMDNLQTMKDNKAAMDTEQSGQGQGAGNGTAETTTQDDGNTDAQEASRGEFMAAQSEFQANFQMFNMMANMTATSLKSLGEGLTSIARKQ
ncbi:MAG: hypothetical protein N0C88_07690 [Candidatus Thiodiazotropha lotti]|uniref:Uncharacterized protein n=1 Tax=Candidatus Thiodiazotropha lotti TaxID=2792787 RepID=A0A9E4K342_9GAMM|nr:hypothetical protein [Candidatus Thiodiazotropha lotti]MCW4203193.1 hypothetical protein [Candidatus Thiodiazotropha lotti]